MSSLMLRKMFGVFEHLTTLFTPVPVSGHGIPPRRILHVVLARYRLRRQQ
jgi:uncharacterized membrane protein